MTSQRKIAILLTLACILSGWIALAEMVSVTTAVANDPAARDTIHDKALERDLDNASKEALDLLQRDAAQPRADWVIVATAGAVTWDFKLFNLAGRKFPAPQVVKPEPGRPPLSDIVVPRGARVVVDVTSNGDIQPFIVPGLAIDKTAIPGRLHRIDIDTSKTGMFPSACADPCTAQATGMAFAIRVVSMTVFLDWYAAKAASAAPPTRR
jgi:heme/copper-type cytochrome/quinol oxidase subunit 2